jgi:hypothetical protein
VLRSKEYSSTIAVTQKHIFGTGFLVGKKIGHIILDFKPISMHMCKLQLTGKFYNYIFIYVHAPMEDKGEEKKRIFLMSWRRHMMSAQGVMLNLYYVISMQK